MAVTATAHERRSAHMANEHWPMARFVGRQETPQTLGSYSRNVASSKAFAGEPVTWSG